MRLFTAIQFSDSIKQNLEEIVTSLKKEAGQGNFTLTENLHLTLVFIGESNRVESIQQCMEQTNFPSMLLEFKEFGKFKRKDGDIYWLGMVANPVLIQLQNALQKNLLRAGFLIEERKFKPHLTLGRQVIVPPGFDLLTFERKIPPISVPVAKISLMKSERIAGRLTYTEIYAKHLAVEKGKGHRL